MHTDTIIAAMLAVVTVWLGLLCFFVGITKFRRGSLKNPLVQEFILHQPILLLVVSFIITLVSERYGDKAWLFVMVSNWYLVYVWWALDRRDLERPWLRKPIMIPLACLALCSVFWVFGFRVNATISLPQGIYRQSADVPKRGDLVGFCLPSDNLYSEIARKRGYLKPGICPNGLQPLMKHLAGLPGDLVEIGPAGISVNGCLILGTVRPSLDSQGRDLPPSILKTGRIPQGHALVLATDHPGSFDSRHFGLVPFGSLKIVNPIFTNSKEKKQ